MSRQQAEKRSHGAEILACWYLQLPGWRILNRSARVPSREVDIFARRGPPSRRLRSKPAETFALDHWRMRLHVRIDAWFIVPRRWYRHLANVWQG